VSDEKSILQRLEDQGREVPRVQLPGGDARAASAPATERYEIVGEIARGGVGVVYKGRDTDLGRDVAMKLLREEHLRSPELVRRFVEEAQIGGQLQHPGIVPVYELGVRERTRPYFAMKLVKGRTLSELLSARSSPSDGRPALLAHFAQVCHTVAYAHSRGVIHRDLKPGNVMVGAFGEVQVVDWGFAKLLKRGGIDDERRARREVTVVATVRSAAEGSASVAGSVMGTPAYMPPEQALGHVDDLTERADVFSLGAILCEILTGKPPYAGDPVDLLTAAAQARLADSHARLDACGGDAELVSLTKACLSPLPKDRPRSARELAETISAHLSGAERRAHEARVRAVEERVKVEEQRRARRQTLAVSSAIVLVVLLLGGGLLAKSSVDAGRERERASVFEAAVRETTRLQASGDWPGARSAVERALGLVGADQARRREAEDLRAGVEAAAASAERAAEKARGEAELLAKLDEIVLRRGDRFDARPSEEEYVAALPDFAALRDFDRREELAAHLDQWAWLRRKRLADLDWRPLDAEARALDPDGWRNGLRDASAAGDLARLRTLAADPVTAAQGPRSLDLLGTVLGDGGDGEAAAELLERAVERYPSDFWIRFHLGLYAGKFDEQQGRYTRAQAAIESFTAAVALRPTSVGAHDHLGIALWSKGEFGAAVEVWLAALRLDPGYDSARLNLGVGLRDKGDLDGAIEAFREAIRLDPASGLAHARLGDALRRKGDLDGAVASFREAIRLDPGSAAYHNDLAVALGEKGDIDGIAAACREAIRLDPKHARAHGNLGLALYHQGDVDGAIAHCREAIRLDPSDHLAYANLALSLTRIGDVDGGIASLREAIRLGASDANVFYNLGNLLGGKGDLAGAIAAYREAIRLDPNYAPARVNLGNALRATGDLAGAIASYREAIRAAPELALAHANLAQALHDGGDVEGAMAAYREAVRVDPTAIAYYHLGNGLQRAGDLEGAIAAYREAIRLDPNLAPAHVNLGNALKRGGNLESAIAEYREAIRIDPNLVPAHASLGAALHDAGDADGAIAADREALRLAPNDADLHYNLGLALSSKGDVDGAIESLRTCVRLAPDAGAHQWLGDLLGRKGDRKGAIEAYRAAIGLDSNLALAHANLGHALGIEGDLAGAVESLRKAASLDPRHPWIRDTLAGAERLAAAHARLPAVLRGEDRPQSAAEWQSLAVVARRTKDHVASARCWREAFESDPRLAADMEAGCRYDAACVAALAGGEWRDHALDWLRADLLWWQEQPRSEAKAVAGVLRHWKSDPDLAGVRDADGLSDRWRALWNDVDALLARAEEASDER